MTTRRTRRSVGTLVLGASVALSLVACGSSSLSNAGGGSTGTAPTATKNADLAAKLPAKVQSAKKIVVGTDASYAPSEFLAADGKTVQGFDVDLFNAVAQKFGVTVQWVPSSFDSIIAGVSTGKYDMGISSFTINADRKKQVNMVSYYNAGTQWVVKKGNPTGITPDNACGKNVAVQQGTVQQEEDLPKKQKACTAAGKPAIKVQAYQGQDEATAAVASGKADAMLADSPVGAYAVKQSNGALQLTGNIYDSAPYGYVVPKSETAFAQAIADALKQLDSEGAYKQALQKWGVEGGGINNFAVNP